MALRLPHALPNLHHHPPRGVLVDLEIARQLERGQAFFCIQHQRDGQKPFLKGQVSSVEGGPDRDAERACTAVATVAVLTLGRIA